MSNAHNGSLNTHWISTLNISEEVQLGYTNFHNWLREQPQQIQVRIAADCPEFQHYETWGMPDDVRESFVVFWTWFMTLTQLTKATLSAYMFSHLQPAVPYQGPSFLKVQLGNFALCAKKNHDYGPENISSTGLVGVAVRLNDKVQRLITLLSAANLPLRPDNETLVEQLDKVTTFESVQDTLADIANYGTIGQMLMQVLWTGDHKAMFGDS